MPEHVPDAELTSERPEWSRPGWVISATFLLVLAVLAIVLWATSPGHHAPAVKHASNPPTSQPPAGTPGLVTANGGGSSSPTTCTISAGDQTVPYNSPPPGITWNQVGSMQAPQAPSTLGPERTNGVWNTCFAHSPAGALLAAFNFWAEGTAARSGQVYQRLAIDVPPQALSTHSRLDDEGPVQFAAYKYETYSPASAQLIVVIKGSLGGLEAAGTTMRWTGSDWRYGFPPNGTPPLEQISDLTGYVQWSVF